MDRRAFLTLGSAGIAGFAGCSSDTGPIPASPPTTEVSTDSSADTHSNRTVQITATVRDDTLTAGDVLEVDVTVINTGSGAETVDLVLALDGNVVTTETVSVPGKQTVAALLKTVVEGTGRLDVTVNDNHVNEITVESGSPTFEIEATLSRETIAAGDVLRVLATVINTGSSRGEIELVLRLDGEPAASEEVTVPAGSEQTVELAATVTRMEPMDVTVNNDHIGVIEVGPPELDELFVTMDGDDDALGRKSEPLATLQEALERAQPGATIRVDAGEYREQINTERPGEPEAPITISGPEDAVVRPPLDNPDTVFEINHSHIHLSGLTLTGLADSEHSEDPDLYASNVVVVKPPTHGETYPDYLTDVKIKPHNLGHARRRLINGYRTNDLEIGEFEIIGSAGVAHFLGGSEGYVIGAFIGLGRSANNFGRPEAGYPWDEPDESHGIHIHHIANLEAHDRTEFVKLHSGMYDVTIEYCTEAGGAGREDSPGTGASIQVPSGDTTIRWCEITDGAENGIFVHVPRMKEDGTYHYFESIPDDRFPGTNNAFYGNRILGNGGKAIAFSLPDWLGIGPERQRVICGNEVDGATDGDPSEACPVSVPEGDGIGYTGGDSPWQD